MTLYPIAIAIYAYHASGASALREPVRQPTQSGGHPAPTHWSATSATPNSHRAATHCSATSAFRRSLMAAPRTKETSGEAALAFAVSSCNRGSGMRTIASL
mgnify:CR=1 FL=1